MGYSPWGRKESDATERLHFTSSLLAHIRSLINTFCCIFRVSLCSKESACNTRDMGSIPGSGRSPGEEMAIHSSILAWRILWTEETAGL